VVHLMKADGVITAVKAISAAYAQFMTDHYEGVRSSESICRESLELSGYVGGERRVQALRVEGRAQGPAGCRV
jgi:hypothetical protein